MTRRKNGQNSSKLIFVCTSYTSMGACRCSQHKVFEDDLKAVLLEDIRKLAKEARKDKQALINKITALMPMDQRPTIMPADLIAPNKRLSEINKLLDALYEDHILGKINEANFERMMEKYQNEQERLNTQIKLLEEMSQESKDCRSNAEKIAELLEEYSEIEELNAGILNALIDQVTVSEPYIVDGGYKQDVTIYYRFIGALETKTNDPTRFYKSRKSTQAAQERAAKRMKERTEAVLKESKPA